MMLVRILSYYYVLFIFILYYTDYRCIEVHTVYNIGQCILPEIGSNHAPNEKTGWVNEQSLIHLEPISNVIQNTDATNDCWRTLHISVMHLVGDVVDR